MGSQEEISKDGALWDDSVLIQAFESAVSKYRGRHNVKSKGEDSKKTSEAADNLKKDVWDTNTSEKNKGVFESVAKTSQSADATMLNHEADNDLRATANNESKQLDDWNEYTNLLNSYNELEMQRQELWQKLQKFNMWQYQAEGQEQTLTNNYRWDGYGTLPANQQTNFHEQCNEYGCSSTKDQNALNQECECFQYLQGAQNSCCFQNSHLYPCCFPCLCPCRGPCINNSACPACVSGSWSTDDVVNCYKKTSLAHPLGDIPANSVPVSRGEDLPETLKETMRSSVFTLKHEIGKISDEFIGKCEKDNSGGSFDSDISEMLHAWFSAGFFTARYLAKRSSGERFNQKHNGSQGASSKDC
eukprot:TRINITY_DN8137_c0_g1_i1.p1 TRINITY_DN8137_c0_g1~~TRINITY_DN8137_c0_g1_i1.p1  ORF type:complete len:395 (-),score=72.17 TRINITY_DN8137_c0_g1_i1:172-1248(-)